ncbi:metal-dependent hydrolase [Halovenus rubra]
MVGHTALAFALAAGVAAAVGLPRERALLFGAVAGAFAVVPDVDMGYAVVGLITILADGPTQFPEAFWETGNTVHRGITHSLLVGGLGAMLFGLSASHGRRRIAGVLGLASLVAVTLGVLGGLRAGVVSLFVLAGGAVVVGARVGGLDAGETAGAAFIGILSHPFGDIFTGTVPHLLYPLDIHLLPKRVMLSADPTVHLLGTFGLELITVWLAMTVYLGLRGERVWGRIHRRAVLGAGYVGTLLALPPPTLSVSYHFVFSVLAVGLVGVVDLPTPELDTARSKLSLVTTGLAAVTIAWLAYSAGYLIVG